MYKIMTTLIIMLSSIQTIHAQHLQKHNDFQELGLSFDLPEGWNGQLYDDKIILGHSAIPGMILLTENPIKNATELKTLAMEGFTEDGIIFKPASDFKLVSQKRVEGYYQGLFNGTEVKVFVIGLINGLGKGMNIIILTEQNKFNNQHVAAANELANSVKFYQSQDSVNTIQWKQKLVGRKLKYMDTQDSSSFYGSSGFSSVKILDLCTNGMFHYYENNHSSFDSNSGNGYGNNNNEGQGTYKINAIGDQVYLNLMFNTGDEYSAQLSINSGKTYLDNDRYFVVESDNCY